MEDHEALGDSGSTIREPSTGASDPGYSCPRGAWLKIPKAAYTEVNTETGNAFRYSVTPEPNSTIC